MDYGDRLLAIVIIIFVVGRYGQGAERDATALSQAAAADTIPSPPVTAAPVAGSRPGSVPPVPSSAPDTGFNASVRESIRVDTSDFTMTFADQIDDRTVGGVLEFLPGVRVLKFGDFGQGEQVVWNGTVLNGRRFKVNGLGLDLAGPDISDITLININNYQSYRVLEDFENIELVVLKDARIFPFTQVDFQMSNFLPFLGIPDAWTLGGVRFIKNFKGLTLFFTYRNTENKSVDYGDSLYYEIFDLNQKTLGFEYRLRQRWDFKVNLGESKYQHTINSGYGTILRQSRDIAQNFIQYVVSDDSLAMAIAGKVEGLQLPNYDQYRFLGDSLSDYRYSVMLEKRERIPFLNQELTGRFYYAVETGCYSDQEEHLIAPSIELTHRLALTSALRGGWHLQVTTCPLFPTLIDPGMTLEYQWGQRATVFLSGARQSRLPTMRELYYGDLDSITRLVRQGNPDLEPENGLAVKGGVRFAAREKLTGTGEGFYKRTRNLIEPDYQPRQVGFANIKDAEHYGVNLTTRYQPNQRFTARLNYSYLLARDKKTGFTLLHRPEHYLRTEGEYRSSYFRNQLAPQVRLAAQYQSGARTYHLAAGREKDLPAVVVFDFTALVNILDAVLMFRVENLFDQEYAFADGPTMPGRVYRMGIRWNFWN